MSVEDLVLGESRELLLSGCPLSRVVALGPHAGQGAPHGLRRQHGVSRLQKSYAVFTHPDFVPVVYVLDLRIISELKNLRTLIIIFNIFLFI